MEVAKKLLLASVIAMSGIVYGSEKRDNLTGGRLESPLSTRKQSNNNQKNLISTDDDLLSDDDDNHNNNNDTQHSKPNNASSHDQSAYMPTIKLLSQEDARDWFLNISKSDEFKNKQIYALYKALSDPRATETTESLNQIHKLKRCVSSQDQAYLLQQLKLDKKDAKKYCDSQALLWVKTVSWTGLVAGATFLGIMLYKKISAHDVDIKDVKTVAQIGGMLGAGVVVAGATYKGSETAYRACNYDDYINTKLAPYVQREKLLAPNGYTTFVAINKAAYNATT